ncbi:MAG: hypothetical protein IPL35_01230 [Sphingobacteriales bacterium]|nr:hypothetical protein [Sphingobacteriales bacterium]
MNINIAAQNYAALVAGVSTVYTSGLPSSMFPYNSAAVPIVAGASTASFPSIFAMAAAYGSGKVVGVAHEGVFGNSDIVLYQNNTFALNICNWLDQSNLNTVAISSGHGEWANYNNLTTFRTNLQNAGYTVTNLATSLTAASLSGKGLLIIGNAWGSFTAAEIAALNAYISGGGGVLMMGLGWSWEAYNSGGAATYPMNIIGNTFGLHWTATTISDATNQYNGQPLFTTLYPQSANLMTVASACDYINNTTATYPATLPTVLQNDATLRTNYINAHLFMKQTILTLPAGNSLRQDIFDCYENLINTYPSYFKKGVIYNSTTQNNFAWIRERVQRNYADALVLTPALKTQISNTLGLSGEYEWIWTNFSTLLADNSALDAPQKSFLFKLYSAIPSTLHNLRLMSFADELGAPPVASSGAIPNFLTGVNASINSFSNTIGTYPENQFPSEVPAGSTDIFCAAAAHEINHIVDAYYIEGNTAFKNRKTQLIAQAGNDSLNYLRSTLPSGFFVSSPQEFIASIANQWCTDTKKALDLALIRFNAGRSQPLNQFLYMANIYTLGLYHTVFYSNNTQANFSSKYVKIGRDSQNRLNSICYDGVSYNFVLDATGNVTAYSTTACTDCQITPTITGDAAECSNNVSVYSIPAQAAGSIYQWIVTGGIIVSGQGTNSIQVQWYDDANGTVKVNVVK